MVGRGWGLAALREGHLRMAGLVIRDVEGVKTYLENSARWAGLGMNFAFGQDGSGGSLAPWIRGF